MIALVIPADGSLPVQEVELVGGNAQLDQLQQLVGGFIEAVPLPQFIDGAAKATGYCNEEGKYTPGCEPNMRATDFMVPGVGLFPNDYIAGNFVIAGFDINTGEHADLPEGVVKRVRLIESEAGLRPAETEG